MMNGFRNLVWFVGVVENNVDERLEGRVQVRAFGFHGTNQQIPTKDLPWALPIIGSYETNYAIPPLNSWVFGFFMDGQEAQQPMLLGLIPTQYITPVDPMNGYGSYNSVKDYDLLSKGSRPSDIGQPMISRLARGEEIEKTYNASIEVTKINDLPVPGSTTSETWGEPGSAYNAQYPFNRVIETSGGHSIELDDTPGAERIMIYHTSGSYVQIDSSGQKTDKSTGDKYDLSEGNHHVYIGGKSIIHVDGDALFYVKGNKYEEVCGDYKTVVHGNYELSCAGQTNINSSDDLQLRAAKVSAESVVENVSIKGAKDVRVASATGIHMKSDAVLNIHGENINLKSGSNINIESGDTLNMKGSSTRLGAEDKVSVSASVVAVDDIIKLSSGDSDAPDGVTDEILLSQSVKMSDPPSKMPNIHSRKGGSSTGGSSGYAANDNGADMPVSYTSDCSTDLVEAIKKYETFSARAYNDYDQISIGYGTKANSINETITEAEATERLKAYVSKTRAYVSNYGSSHGYNWNDCQIDALSSFAYNLGNGSIAQVTNNGTRTNSEIAAMMLQYNKAGGVVLDGLVSRRESESAWFSAGTTNSSTTSSEGTMV